MAASAKASGPKIGPRGRGAAWFRSPALRSLQAPLSVCSAKPSATAEGTLTLDLDQALKDLSPHPELLSQNFPGAGPGEGTVPSALNPDKQSGKKLLW